ncbi:VirK protein [Bordetella sputigena]|uniref:VirK family protein n=1 Tax=Bordetella sputigena TaxID=1416810 RepID=UPI0039F11DE1
MTTRIYQRRAGLRAAVLAGAACAFASISATAQELPDYHALVAALMAGQSVTTLLDLGLCSRDGSDAPGPPVRGGMRITRFLIPNSQYVAFADTHRTLDTEDRPVTEYIRYRAMPDGNVTVRSARLADAGAEVTQRGIFHCRIARGIRFIAGEAPRALPLRTRVDSLVEPAVKDSHADTEQPAKRGNANQ